MKLILGFFLLLILSILNFDANATATAAVKLTTEAVVLTAR